MNEAKSSIIVSLYKYCTYYQMKTKNIPILPKCVQHITHVQGTVHKVKLNIISKIKSVQLYNSS